VPRLILLNGPPGIGKSTLAHRYIEDHPLTLSLEQDVVRGLIGGWRTRENDSGILARKLCVEMARAHLLGGHDVIVPQFVALTSYLDQLAQLARDVAAGYVEVVLLDDADHAERRFHGRLGDPLWIEHQRAAAEFIEAAGGYAYQYQRLLDALAGRTATVISSIEGDVDGTYQLLLAELS
jgi:predicted kinase